MMDEVDWRASYEALLDEYEALADRRYEEYHSSFYRRPAKVRPPRVEMRVRPEPLDVPAEQTPS